MGRLPSRIGARHGGFTAKQWKNWILIYSVVALNGLLPSSHMGCWLLYVHACKLLCKPILKREDIIAADRFLIQYCHKFETLYGKEHCSPSMYLHLHLKECLLDYGPPHVFWCFAFERYNGVLGSYPTNKKNIECQLMRTFLTNQSMYHLLDGIQHQPLKELLPMKFTDDEFESHGCPISDTSLDPIKVLNLSTIDIERINSFDNALIKSFPPFYEKILQQTEVEQLVSVIQQLYPNTDIVHMPRNYKCFGRVGLGGSIIGSTLPGGNHVSSSVIMANWGGSDNNIIDNIRLRVGIVQYYILHSVILQSPSETKKVEHVFAYTLWKKTHPNHDYYGVTSTVSSVLFESPAACCYIPVQRIASLAAHAEITIDLEILYLSPPLFQYITCIIVSQGRTYNHVL